MMRIFMLVFALCASPAFALPWAAPGDSQLRHDLRLLADDGVLPVPLTAWPVSWPDVHSALRQRIASDSTHPAVLAALGRVKARLAYEIRPGTVNRRMAVRASEPERLRTFYRSSREYLESTSSFDYLGEAFAVNLAVTGVLSKSTGFGDDDDDLRFDGSYIAMAVGDWSLSAGAVERYWGPMHSSSLIWSNNARPIPGLSIRRTVSDPFETSLLSWLGRWNVEAFVGQLEKERDIKSALFFGMRVTLMPTDSLEIGFSRTAQWGGKGRPADFETFGRLLVGNDNRGDGGVTANNEPGNQLAGVDWRYSFPLLGGYSAFYGQMIGEDEAGGFPSLYMYAGGLSWVTGIGSASLKVGVEAIATDIEGAGNVAYEHSTVYTSGYRYNGRSIGHAADNDARLVTFFGELADDDVFYSMHLNVGEVNRDLSAGRNSTFPVGGDFSAIDVGVQFVHEEGRFSIGGQFSQLETAAGNESDGSVRFSWEAVW